MVRANVANRVSIPQTEFLAQCMEQFPSLALGNFGKSREESSCARNKWHHLASALNKIKPGVTKTGVGWLRYWTIYKYQLRKRYPQFKHSWMSNEPVQASPLERHFLQVLADCEKNHSSNTMSDQSTKSCVITDKKTIPTESDYQQVNSEPMPIKHQVPQSTSTKQETSQDMPTKQETQVMPITQKTSQPIPIGEAVMMPVVEVCMEKVESPDIQENERAFQDENSTEDPIGTKRETKDEIQIEILKFNFKRQREMHRLEMAQMKERHKLELEILQLKRQKLINDCERLRNNVFKVNS